MNSHTDVDVPGTTLVDDGSRRSLAATLWSDSKDMLAAEFAFLLNVAASWVAGSDSRTAGLMLSTPDDVRVAVGVWPDADGDTDLHLTFGSDVLDLDCCERHTVIGERVRSWLTVNGLDDVDDTCRHSDESREYRFELRAESHAEDVRAAARSLAEFVTVVLSGEPYGACLFGMWLSPDEGEFIEVGLNRLRLRYRDAWFPAAALTTGGVLS